MRKKVTTPHPPFGDVSLTSSLRRARLPPPGRTNPLAPKAAFSIQPQKSKSAKISFSQFALERSSPRFQARRYVAKDRLLDFKRRQ